MSELLRVKDNLFPAFYSEIKTCIWIGNGQQEIECEIQSISSEAIVVKTTGPVPDPGIKGAVTRPSFPMFPAQVTESFDGGFKAQFKEVGIENVCRKEAKAVLATLAAAHNGQGDTPCEYRPGLLARWLIKWQFVIEQSLPHIHNRTFSPQDFPWSQAFEKQWQSVRSELQNVFSRVDVSDIPLGPDKLENWHSIMVADNGKVTDEAKQVFPSTAKLLDTVPSLIYADFSILKPGTELDYHKANSRLFLRLHLSLIIPEGDVCLQLEDLKLHWQEGKVMIFDDYFPHHAWNKTDQTRAVLIVDFFRPMPFFKRLAIRFIEMLSIGGPKAEHSIPKQWLQW